MKTFTLLPQEKPQPPDVHLTIRVVRKHYTIRGATSFQVVRGLLRSPLRTEGGIRAAALTHSLFAWKTEFTAAAPCVVGISADITVTYPRWSRQPIRSRSFFLRWYRRQLLREWRRYLCALRVHENHHVQISIEAVEEMKRQIEALSSRATEKDMAFAITGVCRSLIRQVNERNVRFDLETRNGTAEGGRFNPMF